MESPKTPVESVFLGGADEYAAYCSFTTTRLPGSDVPPTRVPADDSVALDAWNRRTPVELDLFDFSSPIDLMRYCYFSETAVVIGHMNRHGQYEIEFDPRIFLRKLDREDTRYVMLEPAFSVARVLRSDSEPMRALPVMPLRYVETNCRDLRKRLPGLSDAELAKFAGDAIGPYRAAAFYTQVMSPMFQRREVVTGRPRRGRSARRIMMLEMGSFFPDSSDPAATTLVVLQLEQSVLGDDCSVVARTMQKMPPGEPATARRVGHGSLSYCVGRRLSGFDKQKPPGRR